MWHSCSGERHKDFVKRFRLCVPSLSDAFLKLSDTGRKPGYYQRIQLHQSEPDIVVDRHKPKIADNVDGGNQLNNSSPEEIRFADS